MDIKVMCALLSLIESTRIHVLGSGAVESVIVTIDHNIEVTCNKNFWYFSSILVPIIHQLSFKDSDTYCTATPSAVINISDFSGKRRNNHTKIRPKTLRAIYLSKSICRHLYHNIAWHLHREYQTFPPPAYWPQNDQSLRSTSSLISRLH